MTAVCILDYGSGNVRSVYNLFTLVCPSVKVSNASVDIRDASHVVLPGVGAFGAAMRKINQTLPLDVLDDEVRNGGKPFLGICVGMQVLADEGHEFGSHRGLGWISGSVSKVQSADRPLPHIGWNNISMHRRHALLDGFEQDPDFYYLHSFAFRPERNEVVLATTDFGEKFCAIVQQERIFGVQFHPEKSQRAGIKLISNFLALA